MRRSIGLAAAAVAVLVGALGTLGVSAAPPVATDATGVIHWNQVAANTLAAHPRAERRCSTGVPDQHGHGAGRGL